MKFLPIVWRNLLRRKFRTFFTMGAIFFAFLLFGVLMTKRHGPFVLRREYVVESQQAASGS